MGEFIIDFREKNKRVGGESIPLLKYYDDVNVTFMEFDKFNLIMSRADNSNIWSPYISVDKKVLVALFGRIALDSKEWNDARRIEGEGGLACKAMYKTYASEGISGLERLNGSYVVFVYDSAIQKIHLINDRCGMFPCFRIEKDSGEAMIASHPDVLAKVFGVSGDWDMTSIAEFIFTGRLSFPYSYYKNIEALDYGCVHTVDLNSNCAIYESKRKYFSFDYEVDHNLSEWDLAEELSFAFKTAVNKRISEIFGQSAMSMSGGLDCRALLCSVDNRDALWTFCFHDDENYEYRIAKRISEQAGVKFIPIKRSYDYYGEHAEMGIKISGGMGTIIGNHFLGFREIFKELGIDNVITGFYNDYFFKGLLLNRRANKFLRTEKLAEFQYEIEYPYFRFNTPFLEQVEERLDDVFPEHMRNDDSDLGRLKIEQKRMFPLSYEPDNLETLCPLKVMPWYLPTVDNNIIETYLRIPPKFKINASMYSKMVRLQCGKEVSNIPNSNTGAKVNASKTSVFLHRNMLAIKRRIQRIGNKGLVTTGSWPNWQYYLHQSKKVETLWTKKNDVARDIFIMVMGENPYKKRLEDYRGKYVDLFYRLLTMKLWLDRSCRY